MVDTTKRGNINSLTTDSSLGTNTGRVFTGTSVDNGINEDLERVLVRQQVNNLKGVLKDTDGHELLPVVSPVHHERVGQALDDRALF